ncbi:MAG TPA: IPT/TIG domain-containing protein [Myxococcota bacterium]|nr:IPT/TIG domain-containing protein [Myxococcota bacterium]
MVLASPLWGALSSGCSGFGLGDTGLVADDSSSVSIPRDCRGAPVCITQVAPDWGLPAGGTGVEISGWGFTDTPSVFFGSFPIDTVTSFGDDRLVITTPASSVEAQIDVTVVSASGEYTAYDAFTYTSDEPEGDSDADSDADSDSDSDSDTDVTPTGMIGGAVELSYLAYACPDIFGLSDQLQFGVAAVFHAPVSDSWYDDLPTQGSCDTAWSASPPASSYDDFGQWAYLSTGSKSLSLQRQSIDGQPYYIASGLEQGDLVKNASWDLSVPDGDVEVEDVLRTTSGFDSISPAALANDCSGVFAARIAQSGASFTWAPTGTSDEFILWLQFYDPSTGGQIGELICNAEDNGGATLPSSMLSAYPKNSWVVVNMWRRQVSSAVNPADGHTYESASVIGLVGTGTLK